MILYLLIIYLSILIYKIYNLKNYNENAILKNIDNLNIQIEGYPLYYKTENDFNFNNFINNNIYYIIQDNNNFINLSNFNDNNSKNIFINKNYKLYKDLFKEYIPKEYIQNNLINYESISIFKGETNINLRKYVNKENIHYQIYGESIIYLINPKHKDNILNKNFEEIMKWGQKIKMIPGSFLIIPPEWYSIQKSKDISIIYQNEANDPFTIYYYYYNL